MLLIAIRWQPASKSLCRTNRRQNRSKGDLTGIEIISRLMEQVLRRPVEKLQEHRAIAFIPATGGEGCQVLFIDMRTGKFRFVPDGFDVYRRRAYHVSLSYPLW